MTSDNAVNGYDGKSGYSLFSYAPGAVILHNAAAVADDGALQEFAWSYRNCGVEYEDAVIEVGKMLNRLAPRERGYAIDEIEAADGLRHIRAL